MPIIRDLTSSSLNPTVWESFPRRADIVGACSIAIIVAAIGYAVFSLIRSICSPDPDLFPYEQRILTRSWALICTGALFFLLTPVVKGALMVSLIAEVVGWAGWMIVNMRTPSSRQLDRWIESMDREEAYLIKKIKETLLVPHLQTIKDELHPRHKAYATDVREGLCLLHRADVSFDITSHPIRRYFLLAPLAKRINALFEGMQSQVLPGPLHAEDKFIAAMQQARKEADSDFEHAAHFLTRPCHNEQLKPLVTLPNINVLQIASFLAPEYAADPAYPIERTKLVASRTQRLLNTKRV